jgi:hypothetical protein
MSINIKTYRAMQTLWPSFDLCPVWCFSNKLELEQAATDVTGIWLYVVIGQALVFWLFLSYTRLFSRSGSEISSKTSVILSIQLEHHFTFSIWHHHTSLLKFIIWKVTLALYWWAVYIWSRVLNPAINVTQMVHESIAMLKGVEMKPL